ncbi:hypothetical protein Tco_0435971 [Tanacetum coccineum]
MIFMTKRVLEPKLKTVVNTGQRVVKPVDGTGLVNPVRPNGKRAVHTVSTARPISTARLISTARPGNPESILQIMLVVDRDSDPKRGKPPSISFMRPFGCPLTILNTLDPLGKFDGKSDEGYLLGYSTTSKAFRDSQKNKRVEENIHIDFLEDQPNVAGNGSSNKIWVPTQEYILLPLHPHRPRISVEDVVQAAQEKPSKNSPKDNDVQDSEDVAEKEEQHTLTEAEQALKDDLEREKVAEVKEEEPVKRTGKRKKQKARKGICVDKNAQGDSETDKEESVEAMNPTPLATKSNIVVN